MPTYVYACDTCGKQFEQFQSFKEEPLRSCPTCQSAVRRVFQPAGIVFKGSGWYINDSRGSSTSSISSDSSSKVEKSEKNEKSEQTEKAQAPAPAPAPVAPTTAKD